MKQILYLLVIITFTSSCLEQVTAQIPVRNEHGFLLIEYDGEVLTNNTYDYIGKESSRLFVAVKNGKWGYLNRNGQEVVPLTYDVAYPFKGEFALVARNGNYFQINKQNKVLNTLSWAQAPVVFDKQFLIVNKNTIYDKNGDLLYKSKSTIYNAPKSGIIEYDKDSDTAFQYTLRRGSKRLVKIREHIINDTIFVTQQGYFGVVHYKNEQKTFSIFNDRGQSLVNMPSDGVHPNYIRVVWRDYIYNPQGQVFYPEILYGQETHFPMKHLIIAKRNSKSQLNFQLSDKYFNDRMSLLPRTKKWIRFDGYNIIGNYIFDDVVPGDNLFTPVKMGRDWYILNKRKDTLQKTPFKYVHPLGMNERRFFASTQNSGSHGEKWSYVNLDKGIVTDEIFGVPVLPRNEISLFEETVLYEWNDELNEVIIDGKKAFINNLGEVVWTNPESKPLSPYDYFKTKFEIRSGNYTPLNGASRFDKKQISVRIKAAKNGVNVAIANTSMVDKPIEIQDGKFQARLEYKNSKGEWEAIAYLSPSWCGNSYYPTMFPANKMTNSIINLPQGNSKMLVRVSLVVNHEKLIKSNEIWINTNGGRMRIPEYYGNYGLTIKP